MDTITYKRNIENTDDNKEPNIIKFNLNSNLTIQEFKIICIRLAYALGYADVNIKNEFGNIDNIEYNKKILFD